MHIKIRSKSRTIWIFVAASLVFHAVLFFALRELKPDTSEEEPQGPLRIRSLLLPEWEREQENDQSQDTASARAAEQEEPPRLEDRREEPDQEQDRPRETQEQPDAAEGPAADPESRVAEALGGWDPDMGRGFEEEGRNSRGPGGPGEAGDGSGKQVPFSSLAGDRDLEVPEYPELARKWGWQGVVVLRIDVDPDGNVVSAEVLESSGYEILDKAAVDTVKNAWSFRPPGEFVTTIKEIEFVLREGS